MPQTDISSNPNVDRVSDVYRIWPVARACNCLLSRPSSVRIQVDSLTLVGRLVHGCPCISILTLTDYYRPGSYGEYNISQNSVLLDLSHMINTNAYSGYSTIE